MEMVEVKVSSKWARHLFLCSPTFIRHYCHGRCCEGIGRLVISLTPDEAKREVAKGFAVKDGLLQADPATGLCPYKQTGGFCLLHGSPDKPLNCVADPFTVRGKTLVVRYRYALLKCGGHGEPAYKVFRASLDRIFGDSGAAQLCEMLDNGASDVRALMPAETYNALVGLNAAKRSGVET